MNRQEFLNRLEEALEGEVSPRVIQDNLRYYRDFISGEISRGRREEDVMEELGDPRLIARTIIDADGAAEGNGPRDYREPESRYSYGETEREPYRQYEDTGIHVTQVSSWKIALIVVAVVVVLLIVLSTVFSLALVILRSPVFWVLVIVWLIWRLVADQRGPGRWL